MIRLYLGLWRRLLRFCDVLEEGVRPIEKRAAAAIPVLALIVAGLAWCFSGADGTVVSSTVQAPVRLIRFGVGLACVALLFIGYAGLKDRRMLPLWAGAGLLSVLALSFEAPYIRLLLLEGAAFIALALVWKASEKRAVSRIYLLMVLLSAAATAGGTFAMDSGRHGLVLALLIAGFSLKLALAPLSLWLPMVAEAIPAPLVGLLVAVLDVAAFGELLVLRQTSAWLFVPSQLWLAIALLSALGGAALMLAQRDLKRMLAFSTIEDMGYLILGVAAGGELGIGGAALGVGVHALAKALLFGSLTTAEADFGPVTLGSGGLASRYPWSATAFLAGSLAMLGIPPLAGFAARWQLYESAIRIGPVFLGLLLLATALSVLAYSRALVQCWWGPATLEESGRKEPAILVAAMAGICAVLLAVGLWPAISIM